MGRDEGDVCPVISRIVVLIAATAPCLTLRRRDAWVGITDSILFIIFRGVLAVQAPRAFVLGVVRDLLGQGFGFSWPS